MIQYRIPSHVLAAYPGDEAVLLHTDGKRYFRLNQTAARMFRGVEQGMSEEAIVDDVCTGFEVTRDVASAELGRLLDELCALGLVDREPPTA